MNSSGRKGIYYSPSNGATNATEFSQNKKAISPKNKEIKEGYEEDFDDAGSMSDSQSAMGRELPEDDDSNGSFGNKKV